MPVRTTRVLPPLILSIPWIAKLMGSFGLKELALAGVEGLPAQSEAKINALDDESYEAWLDIIYKTSTDPLTWASCEHLLYIGRKT